MRYLLANSRIFFGANKRESKAKHGEKEMKIESHVQTMKGGEATNSEVAITPERGTIAYRGFFLASIMTALEFCRITVGKFQPRNDVYF